MWISWSLSGDDRRRTDEQLCALISSSRRLSREQRVRSAAAIRGDETGQYFGASTLATVALTTDDETLPVQGELGRRIAREMVIPVKLTHVFEARPSLCHSPVFPP
jgi:hypothetical protein